MKPITILLGTEWRFVGTNRIAQAVRLRVTTKGDLVEFFFVDEGRKRPAIRRVAPRSFLKHFVRI